MEFENYQEVLQERFDKREPLRQLEIEEKFQEIISFVSYHTRRTGNTAWILNSAIQNPRCYIVFRSNEAAKHYKGVYSELIRSPKHGWLNELGLVTNTNDAVDSSWPKFIGIESLTKDFILNLEQNAPVIFDNSAFSPHRK